MLLIVFICVYKFFLFNLFYIILHQDVLDVFCMRRFGIERQRMSRFEFPTHCIRITAAGKTQWGVTTGRHNGKMMQNEKCHFDSW